MKKKLQFCTPVTEIFFKLHLKILQQNLLNTRREKRKHGQTKETEPKICQTLQDNTEKLRRPCIFICKSIQNTCGD